MCTLLILHWSWTCVIHRCEETSQQFCVWLNMRPCSQFHSGMLHNQNCDPARTCKKRLLHNRVRKREMQKGGGGGCAIQGCNYNSAAVDFNQKKKQKNILVCVAFNFPYTHCPVIRKRYCRKGLKIKQQEKMSNSIAPSQFNLRK